MKDNSGLNILNHRGLFKAMFRAIESCHLLPEQDVRLDERLDEGHALLEVNDVAPGSLDEEEISAGQVGGLVGQVGLFVAAPVAVVAGGTHELLAQVGL